MITFVSDARNYKTFQTESKGIGTIRVNLIHSLCDYEKLRMCDTVSVYEERRMVFKKMKPF